MWQHPYVSVFTMKPKAEWSQKGDVSHVMDKSIGKKVLKIRGRTAATNLIEVPARTDEYAKSNGLALTGRFVYIQLRPVESKLLTFHNPRPFSPRQYGLVHCLASAAARTKCQDSALCPANSAMCLGRLHVRDARPREELLLAATRRSACCWLSSTPLHRFSRKGCICPQCTARSMQLITPAMEIFKQLPHRRARVLIHAY